MMTIYSPKKKALSFLLAVLMLLSTAAPAFADVFAFVTVEEEQAPVFTDGELTNGDDATYSVSVAYGEAAQIPEGARLETSEILEDDPYYNMYRSAALEKAGVEEDNTLFVRLFDISIRGDEGKIQPAEGSKVDVKISVDELNDLPEGANVRVLHFPDENPVDDVEEQAEEPVPADEEIFPADDLQLAGQDLISNALNLRDAASLDVQEYKEVSDDPVLAPDAPAEGVGRREIEEPEVVEAEVVEGGIVFSADGFSVYAIVGTENHKARVKYIFQNSDGTPYYFTNHAGETVDNQIIKNGEYLEDVGVPEVQIGNGEDETFNGWFIYFDDALTGEQISFLPSSTITINLGADSTSLTSRRVDIKDEDNTSPYNADTRTYGEDVDYTVYVRPSYGPVHYLTFWNEVDGNVIYTRVQVPHGSTYNISQQSAIPPDAIVDPATGEVQIVTYAFTGWSYDPGTYAAMAADTDTRTAITNTTVTVNGDMDFYPIFKRSHWINFISGDIGSGASYVPPAFVIAGQMAASARPTNPTWEGHDFVGWFETPDTDYLSANESTNGAFNFNQVLNEDKILYAHWNAGTANYTIVYWQQLVTDNKNADDADKNYEYAGQENRTASVNTTVNAGTVATIPTGYHINTNKGNTSTTILPDGTAVLNVYLDRNLVTMRFWKEAISYNSPDFTSPNWTNPTYADTYTGLYGQTWAQAGYPAGWPSPGTGYMWYYYNTSNGVTGKSFLGQFVPVGDERQPAGSSNEIRFYKTSQSLYTIEFFLQNTDGSTYGNTPADTGVGPRRGSFTFTEKYDGFELDQYRIRNNNTWGAWSAAVNGRSVTLTNNMQVRYKRKSFEFKFLDSRNGTELTDAALQSRTVVYEAPLSGIKPDVTTITPPSSEYEWDGKWYKDQACTEEFDWNETMPMHDYSVYVKWNQLWYWVKVDPDGGELSASESTWFWETKGGFIQEYYDVTRRYVEDPSGEYYYHYDEFDTSKARPDADWTGTDDEWDAQYQPATRDAEYRLISENPDWENDSYDGKRYKLDNNAYSLVGWYEVDKTTGQLIGLFDFDGGVTGDVYLRAVWRTIGKYQVWYSLEGVDENGNPVYLEDVDGNPTTERATSNGPAPVDGFKYADKSNSSFKQGITAPAGYVFTGWYYDGKVYSPGDAFMVKSELAVTEQDPVSEEDVDVVWVYPVFIKYENLPVKTTHIYWYGNTMDKNGLNIEALQGETEPSNTTRDANLQINESVNIMSIDELLDTDVKKKLYEGYEFKGWAKLVENDSYTSNTPLWLTWDPDSKTYTTSDGDTGVTKIAADEVEPYDKLVAVWEKKTYTVTVKKIVESEIDSDQEIVFAFTPVFSTTIEGGSENFGLTGREITVTSDEGEFTFYSEKNFFKVPYGTTFSITEEQADDFETPAVVAKRTKNANGETDDTTLVGGNGSTFTVDGDIEVTFTNTRKKFVLDLKKVDADDKTTILEGAVFKLVRTTGTPVAYPNGEHNEYTFGEGKIESIISGTYELTENKAPSGYIILANKIEFTIDSEGNCVITNGQDYAEVDDPISENSIGTIVIKNTPGTELPHTGASHPLAFTIAGLAMVGAVGAVLHYRKKHEEE